MNELSDNLGATPPADRNPVSVHLAGLGSGHSRDAILQAATKALSLLLGQPVSRDHVYRFPWGSLRYQHVVAIRQALADAGYAPATTNAYIAHVKSICREAWRLGHLDSDAHARIADVGGVKGTRLPAGRALSAGELHALFQACSGGAASDVRDCALLATMYGTGVRRGELVALQLADYDPEAGSVRVLGKGNRERWAYLPSGARVALAAWLAVRGYWEGALFVPVSRAGRIGSRPLSTQAVSEVCERRARAAGIARFTAHDLRRSHITHLLDAGCDLSVVARCAGHSQISTTQSYDMRPEAEKRRAADMLVVPMLSSS